MAIVLKVQEMYTRRQAHILPQFALPVTTITVVISDYGNFGD